MPGESFIHPTVKLPQNVEIGRFCIIEAGVVIGEGVQIEEFSLIQAGAKIGRGTRIGTHSKIGENAVVGDNCSFTAYCEIRAGCLVGNRVSMGSRCTLSAGTIVGDDVSMKYGFVAADTPVLTEDEKKVTCILKDGSLFGANVTIMPAVTVGERSEIGACSQVRHDVPPGQIWYGSPARYFRDTEKE